MDNLVGKKNALACVFCLHIRPVFERFALGSSAAHQPSDLPNAETPQALRPSHPGETSASLRRRGGLRRQNRPRPKTGQASEGRAASPADPVRSTVAPVKKVSRGPGSADPGKPAGRAAAPRSVMRLVRNAARMGRVEGTLGAADFRAIRVARGEAALTAAHGQLVVARPRPGAA